MDRRQAVWRACTVLIALVGLLVAGCRSGTPGAGANDALFEAIRKGEVAAAQRALDAGADIEAKNRSGRTPLMMAAVTRNAALVKALLARKADVGAQDASGMTALMWAAFGGSPAIVQALLDAGSDVNAQDRNGETALMWAGTGNREAAQLLKKSGAKTE